MTSNNRSLFGAVGHYAAAWRSLRDRLRTEAILNNLPANIRKDIGWPDVRGPHRGDGPSRL